MIFVTTGAQKYNFKRLFEYLDELDDEVIIQAGVNKITKKYNYQVYDYIPMSKVKEYIDNCDIFITHGGPNDIFYAIKKHKKVIVVPRLKKYHEHSSDHQLIFANYLDKNKYCYVARNKKEFISCIKHTHKLNKYQDNREEFLKNINKEVETLLGDNYE